MTNTFDPLTATVTRADESASRAGIRVGDVVLAVNDRELRGMAVWDSAVVSARPDEIALFVKAAKAATPATPQSVPLTTLIPAFVLSELRAAFIIGFVVYIPFLVVDMVVSASLMSMGMMMLPPVTVSLPFKMLLFVMVNGWGLVITALVASY